MAETIATELVKVLFQKLSDEAFKRIARAQGIHKELKELRSTFSRVQDLLHDASNKEVYDITVKSWLNGLQHLAYDIDDILDDLATEDMHRELTLQEPGASSTSMVRKLMPSCCTNLSLSHRLSPKLDSITTQLQHLEKRKSDLGLIKIDEKPKNTSRRSETSLPERDVVGREVEKELLLRKLLSNDGSSQENFSILPIVGMGGVGKTTLARLLYNDTKVKGHFDLKAWVCISDDFDIFKISDTILRDVTKINEEFKDLNQLQIALAEQFTNKKFLLVVDDVWTENYGHWEKLVRPFLLGAPGSRIIMTTRKEQLLKNLGFDNLDRLKSLSNEDALSLFALHALGVDNFDSHPTLKPYGEGIVKKCACLPLALKAIGRLLRTRTKGEDWDDVLNSEIWNLKNTDNIVPALRLSYHDLSADLKQLFAYCSLFPKGFLFDKEQLVLLWMAEGFLNSSDVTKSPERVGYDYFDILLTRSFFQHAPSEKSLFVMHDLMVDLATFVARDFFLRLDNHMCVGNEALAKHRYMSFSHESYVSYYKVEPFKVARSLRTLLPIFVGVNKLSACCYLSNKILFDLLPGFPLLRVLSLSYFRISEVPEFIGNLKHLRYLNLSRTLIQELPENVGNLCNLQTLIVSHCQSLIKLPKSFLKLKKLRHFDIRDTMLLKLPMGILGLENLQTLTNIIIEGDDGLSINEIKGLKNLHGEISIIGLHKVQHAMHAREANLSLKKITRLELKWVDLFDGSRSSTLENEVLSEMKPNSDMLKELAIVSYGGTRFPNWVGESSFHDLVNVSIHGCRKCTSLPPFGQLSSLKELLIQGMDEVGVIGSEFAGTTVVAFPSLEILRFIDMLGWEVWSTKSEGIDVMFPCLQQLQIMNCPNLINVSLEPLPSLRLLRIFTCSSSALRSLVHVALSINRLHIGSISGLKDEVWRGVIDYLRVVEIISISGCDEIRYLWESEAAASKVLVNLNKLQVERCSNLVSLGEKEDEDNFDNNLLSSLTHLEVSFCENIEHCCCPNNIEILDLFYCSSLTCVSFQTKTGGGQKLKSLKIDNCKKLMKKINTTGMPMLESVKIEGWINLRSIIHLSDFIHLTNLHIISCPGIESFPDLQLLNLTFLSISYCRHLESLPVLSNLTLLKHVEIRNCISIDGSFPCGIWPPKLCSLRIGRLKKPISEWGVQNFPTSLVDLTLWGDPYVSDFSQLSHLFPSSLTELCIEGFDKLESISMGLQHLTFLQHLSISRCPKVNDLPERLLPSLLSLRIHDCPNLKERCNGRGSHYWPLVWHIPCITIGNNRYADLAASKFLGIR